VPYEPPSVLVEQVSFEDGVEAAPQLLFAVRGLASRLSARLTGRRQATNRVEVILGYDRSIFTLRSREARPGEPALSPSRVMGFELPAPLSHTDDIFRAVKAKVEVTELAAPVVRLEIRLSRVVRAPEIQLDLSRDVSVSPDALPALLSELSAELGEGCVGVLSSVDDHRPERRTALIGVHEAAADRRRRAQGSLFEPAPLSASEPARLLPEPAWVGSALEGERRVPRAASGPDRARRWRGLRRAAGSSSIVASRASGGGPTASRAATICASRSRRATRPRRRRGSTPIGGRARSSCKGGGSSGAQSL
jgi:hypothetical protein